MNKASRWIFCTVGGLLTVWLLNTSVCAQDNWNRNSPRSSSDAQVQQAMQNAWLAESIVAMRESASGRSFDPAFRASLKNTLAKQPTARLESILNAGGEGRLDLTAVGDTSADLVYTPVTPCRVFDTRYSMAGILAADTQRNFYVAGTGMDTFGDQGGYSGGCGIPYGSATAVIINFAAVAPTGPGNLRAWAAANPERDAPLAAVMNFSPAMNVLANGVAVPICDLMAGSCTTGDLRLQADVSSVHVVGDVVGYFRKLDLPAAMPMGSEFLPPSTVSGEQCIIGTEDVVLPHDGSCLVTCNLGVQDGTLNSTGFLVMSTARRDVAAATNAFDSGNGIDFTVPSIRSSASDTYTWRMTGGRTYRFGCWVNAQGDFEGASVIPNVSWICR